MDTIPAGLSDIFEPAIIFAAWTLAVGLNVVKASRWLRFAVLGPVAFLLLWNLSSSFPGSAIPALHWYVPQRIGRPASIVLDLATLGAVILFLVIAVRQRSVEEK